MGPILVALAIVVCLSTIVAMIIVILRITKGSSPPAPGTTTTITTTVTTSAAGPSQQPPLDCWSLQNQYQIVPGQSWGSLKDSAVKSWWGSNNCDARVATTATTTTTTTPQTQVYTCQSLKDQYQILPGRSWGSLMDPSIVDWWGAHHCDSTFGTTTTATTTTTAPGLPASTPDFFHGFHATSYEWGYWQGSWGDVPNSVIDQIQATSSNIVRLGLRWDNAQPTMKGPLDSTYIASVKNVISYVANRGMTPILDSHCWAGRQTDMSSWAASQHIGVEIDISNYVDYWSRLHDEFGTIPGIMYELCNEPFILHEDKMDSQTWAGLMQQVITMLRQRGFNGWILFSDPIFHTGVANNLEPFGSLQDPKNMTALTVHSYNSWWDVQGNMQTITDWIRSRGKKVMMTEFGFGTLDEVQPYVSFMNNNRDAWLGFTYFCCPNNNFSRNDPSVSYVIWDMQNDPRLAALRLT